MSVHTSLPANIRELKELIELFEDFIDTNDKLQDLVDEKDFSHDIFKKTNILIDELINKNDEIIEREGLFLKRQYKELKK